MNTLICQRRILRIHTHHVLLEDILIGVRVLLIASLRAWVSSLQVNVSRLCDGITKILLSQGIEFFPVRPSAIEALMGGILRHGLERQGLALYICIVAFAHIGSSGLIASLPKTYSAYESFSISAVEVSLIHRTFTVPIHQGYHLLQVFQYALTQRVAVGQVRGSAAGHRLISQVTIPTCQLIIERSTHRDGLAIYLRQVAGCSLSHHVLIVRGILHLIDDVVRQSDDLIQ